MQEELPKSKMSWGSRQLPFLSTSWCSLKFWEPSTEAALCTILLGTVRAPRATGTNIYWDWIFHQHQEIKIVFNLLFKIKWRDIFCVLGSESTHSYPLKFILNKYLHTPTYWFCRYTLSFDAPAAPNNYWGTSSSKMSRCTDPSSWGGPCLLEWNWLLSEWFRPPFCW